jgi:hypothetical protein
VATKTPVGPSLSDAQLAEMMSLLRGSDTVELKLTVPASQQRAAISALGLDALDAQIRQVIFFDTPDLALDRAGVVVRARRIQGRVGDSVIKLRPLDPDQVSGGVRQLSGFGVEVDAIPGGFVCSGRLKCDADSDAIHRSCSASVLCASSTPRSSVPCTGTTLPTGSSWTISPCSGRSSCSS